MFDLLDTITREAFICLLGIGIALSGMFVSAWRIHHSRTSSILSGKFGARRK